MNHALLLTCDVLMEIFDIKSKTVVVDIKSKMGSTQQFCLKWNNYQGNLISVFDSLLKNEYLVDVTLACEGSSIKAHKLVLSACSPFFEELFRNNPCQHPVIILKDMAFSDLEVILKFMYKGEVSISQDKLSYLLKMAESLQIKGLSEIDSNKEENPQPMINEASTSKKRKFSEIGNKDITQFDEENAMKTKSLIRVSEQSNQHINLKIPQSAYSNDSSRVYSCAYNESVNSSPLQHQHSDSSSHEAHLSSHNSNNSATTIPTQRSALSSGKSGVGVASSSEIQSFSQSQFIPEHKVRIKLESVSPDIAEDVSRNNQEYILEPSDEMGHSLSEAQYTEEEIVTDQSVQYPGSYSNLRDISSQDFINSQLHDTFSDFDQSENYGTEINLNQSKETDNQPVCQGNSTPILKDTSSKKACPYCMKLFHPLSVRRHVYSVHFPNRVVCRHCNKTFCRNDVLKQHILDVHKNE